MPKEYSIELGVGLNKAQLNTVKEVLKSIESQKREVIYDVDFNIKNVNKLTRVGKEIDEIKAKLKELDNIGSIGKGKAPIAIDSKSLETSLNKIHDSIRKLQNAFGKVDSNKGVQSLLTTVNKIRKSLEDVSAQFEGLNKNLSALSSKDFSLNFDFGFGKSGAKNPEQAMQELKMLRKEIEEYQKYFSKFYALDSKNTDPINRLMLQHNQRNQLYMMQLQQSMNKGSDAQRIAAAKEYIKTIKETAKAANIALEPVEFKLAESSEFIRVRNEASETEKQLKEMFSGGIDAAKLHQDLTNIAEDLRKIQEFVSNVSKNANIEGLTQSFNKLSETLEKLAANIVLTKNNLDTISADTHGDITSRDVSTDAVVQGEDRKRQALEQTADTYESVAQRARQAGKLISDSAQEAIDSVSSKSIDKAFIINESDSIKFRREMENLVSQWTDAKGKLTDIKINTDSLYDADTGRNIERVSSAIVTYNNELGETIRKTIALRQIGTDVNVVDGNEMSSPVFGFVEVSGQYSKSLGKTKAQTDAFVKQQKQAVANLTNQINQLNRAANDQNAQRPIKDSAHLDALSAKYNEVTDAIQRMKSASSDTFVDEQNNVKSLISDFKSLVSEYKNAENVSNKMKGTDFASGLEIAKNDLEKFKADAKDFPQIAKTISSLNDEIGKVGDASSLNKFNDQLRVARSELAKIKSETNAANRSEKVGINVSGLESKIADLQRISPEINKFETEIDGAKVSVQSLLNDLRKIDTQSDFSVVNSKFRAFTDAAKAAGIAVTDTAAKAEAALAKDIKLDIELGNFDNDISLMHDKFNKLSGASDELCESVRKTETAYQNLVNAAKPIDDVVDNEKLIRAQKEYAAYLEKTNNLIKIQAREEKAAAEAQKLAQDKESLKLDTVNWLNENTRAAKEYGAELNRLISLLDKVDDPVAFKEIARDIKNVQKTAQTMGKTGLTAFDKLKEKAKEYMTYLSAAELFMYAEQALRSMFEQVKLIDSAMTELKKVTDETDASYEQFLTNAASKAKEIGTTIDGLVSSTADFARLGYDFADAQGLAEVANIYAVVGDDIDSVEAATQSLISTLTAFKDEAVDLSESEFALSIVDKMNEVANNFAISSGGIGDALQRSASSMMAANNSLDETIALITAANTVVQDPDSVGTAFKTISMRIRGAKTELEEAGLETEGMAESTAKLREEIMALSGVDIMLNDNEFKSTYQIMDELADKWQDLTDIQQASVTELIAGKRQGNIISSLMNNFDIAEQALETSLNSSGSAMKEHEKWQQSLEAQILSLKASWQGLSQAFLSSDFLKVVLDGVVNLVDGFTKLIDTFGTLPTLTGTFAAGFSLFKNGGIFKTFNTDLDTFTSKIGIANKSFAELANAFNSGKTGTGFKGFISGLKSVGDSLTNTLSKADLSAIESYNKLLDAGVDGQTAFAQSMKGTSSAAQNLVIGANGSKVAISGMSAATNASKVALIGAKAAAIAFNAALTMGISLLITWAVQGISKLINAKEELAEKVEEVTSKYRDQHSELSKLKGDYDTSNEESMISRYGKLSKGVNELGENVSLTADEYSEYQSIVGQIANQNPELVTGYNSQGDAILSCAGNVDALRESYEKLIKVQNDAVLDSGADIFKDFKNDIDGASKGLAHGDIVGGLEELENIFKVEDIESFVGNLSGSQAQQISRILEDYGIERDVLGSGEKGYETWQEHIIRAVKKNSDEVKSVLDKASADINAYADDLSTVTDAYLSNAFLGDYSHFSNRMQNVINQITSGFDSGFYAQFLDDENPYESLTNYFDGLLSTFDKMNKTDAAKLEAAFDLKTQFNGGEIPYGEYVSSLEEAGNLVDRLNLDEDTKKQIKLSIGLNEDGLVEEYQSLLNRLSKDADYDFNITENGAKDFLDELTADELSVAVDVIAEMSENGVKETVDDIKSAIDREMVIRGLTFDLNLEVEAAGLEALNTALAESVSATGLSSDSISALKGRYADLESQGYDLSVMFEETSTGIRLNRQEFDRLESAYSSQKLAEVDGDLKEMKETYDELGEAIKNCDDPIKKSELFNDRQTLAKKISEAATLAHQYKGLTSAYNEWLSAEEAGQERDMYEKIIEGFENVGDEISRGWMDDGTIKFLELLTGQTDLAGKSGKDLLEIYNGLSKKIGNSKYSIRDFFTVDEDGNSTNAGVYNFLETIESVVDGVIERGDDGNIIGFNFGVVGGDKAIADALGISEELVQIMVRAADDAGFVVSMDGTYKQLADLQNEARAAANYLKEIGKTDFEFDFNTSDIKNLNAQLEEAKNILADESFWNADGTFNFDADGATEAMQIVSTLQAKIDTLTSEKYGIGLTVEDEEFEEPLENLQEYGRKVATLNQLELNPKANVEEIEKINGELNDIAEYFANLDKETKIKLGFEADDGIEEIKSKIENGEVKIPTVLDIQANMDKNIEILADLALLNSGLLSEGQEKTIRAKYNVEVEAEEVDVSDAEEKVNDAVNSISGTDAIVNLTKFIGEYTPNEREVVLKFLADTSQYENFEPEEKEAVVKFIADTIDVEGYTPEEKEAYARYIADGGDLDSYSPEEKNAIVKYLVDGGDIDNYTPEEKTAITKFLADTGEVDSYTPEQKQAIAKFIKDSLDVDNYQMPTNKQAYAKYLKDTYDIDTWTPPEKDGGIANYSPYLTSTTLPTLYGTAHYKAVVAKVNGTANVNGTAFADGTISGRAFKKGDWGIKDSGTALVGELGQETVVRDGRFFTIGDNGAEFFQYRKGDIIFNHKQTEELFKNGKVTAGGGRGKALASGTAFAEGTAFSLGSGGIGKVEVSVKDGSGKKTDVTVKATGGSNGSGKGLDPKPSGGSSNGGKSSGSGGGGGSSAKDEAKETFDWIEVAIDRIERAIDKLDRKVNSVFEFWSTRNASLIDEISKVRDEIELQEDAYERYIQEANSVGLSADWAEKVRNGKIDIETITDEALAEKIKEYQEWYEKAIDCQDAIEELREKEAELYQQRFENVSAQYEGILGVIEHEKNMLEEYIAQSEANAQLVSSEYYEALMGNEEDNLARLEQQKADMVAELEAAMASGTIAFGSEAYYEMVAAIDEVTLAIAESQTAMLEYEQILQQLSWEAFDLLQEKISAVTDEADFLIELLSNDKLHGDNGQLTDEGMATMGLHGQKYNTYMYQADLVAEEIERLKAQLEEDPFDTELQERYQEMIALQQEYILAAEEEKQAIVDLVKEGIELELDALQERIDKYNESIEAAKDLYEYNKRIKEQAAEIASLEKQMAAYDGDDSEEAQAKIQELKVSLEEAKTELQETEYDKYISDQQQLLDELYLEYEEILNMRLDNIDALISDMIEEINADAGAISDTISGAAESVGYTLSDAMSTTWDASTTDINNVLTTYGEGFINAQTTTNNALGVINANLQNVINQLNSIAHTNVESASVSSIDNEGIGQKGTGTPSEPPPSPTPPDLVTPTSIGVGSKINAGDAKIYDYAGDKSGERQFYRNDPVYNVLKTDGNWLQVRWHKLFKGVTGWFKKVDVKPHGAKSYKSGARRIDADDAAWTQEGGKQEYIVRPSDGAILTPVAKSDSILNAQASGNIWNMANSPAEFIRNNLNLGVNSVPNNSNIQSNYIQHLENVVFSFPNVQNYDEMLRSMRDDKNFERLISSMTVDRLAGKSSLAKGKSIR